jgi:hypothetical protein
MERCSRYEQSHVKVARVVRGSARPRRTGRTQRAAEVCPVTTPSHGGIAPSSVRDLRGAPDDDPERKAGTPPGLAPTLVVRPRSQWSWRPHGRTAARGNGALDDRASCARSDGTLGLPRSARAPGRHATLKPSLRPCNAPPSPAWASCHHHPRPWLGCIPASEPLCSRSPVGPCCCVRSWTSTMASPGPRQRLRARR